MKTSKKILIYCRESRDDYFRNYERIETQRDILLEFCKRKELGTIVDIIMDDNVSGTDFRRFENILNLAREGRFDIIVFKDASRLGRNLLESLRFTEELSKLGIDILFENEEYNEDIFPLKAWFNEQRAKEDSVKIRNVLKHKMETGQLLIKPVYGYSKQGNNLLINEEQSQVVRKIFDFYEKGLGTGEIASYLNQNKVKTPSQDKNLKNSTNLWNRQHILRILDNEVYTGKMIYSKRCRRSYKDKSVAENPKENWIIIENHHEPIITAQQFTQIEKMRNKRKNKTCKKGDSPFSHLLKCGCCGSSLILRTRKNRGNYYICSKYHREGLADGNKGCGSHILYEGELYESVIDYLKRILSEYLEAEKKDRRRTAVESAKEEEKKYRAIIERIYDDRLNSIIDESMYRAKSEKYFKLIEELKVQTEIFQENEPFDNKGFMGDISSSVITSVLIKNIFKEIIFMAPKDIENSRYRIYLSEEEYEEMSLEGGILFLRQDNFN